MFEQAVGNTGKKNQAEKEDCIYHTKKLGLNFLYHRQSLNNFIIFESMERLTVE